MGYGVIFGCWSVREVCMVSDLDILPRCKVKVPPYIKIPRKLPKMPRYFIGIRARA